MKKILIITAMLGGLVLGAPSQSKAVSCPSNDPAVSCPTVLESACSTFTRNLGVGSRNLKNDTQVTLLQNLLQQYGYFNVEPTGYFGSITLQAVKDYQRANGVPPTGFVGVLTRAKLNICDGSVQASNLKITAPKGGELWNRGTAQTISWTDSNTYIVAPKYDVKVQLDLDCKPGQPCILLYPIPMTIAKDVMNTSFTWNAGDNTDATRTMGDGKYRVYVCPAGRADAEDLNGCAKSASYITLITLPTTSTTTTIGQLSTTTGPIGTTVRILGNNLNNVKNINFGSGFVPKSAITVGPVGFTGVSYLEFKVPNQLAPECYYQVAQCKIAAVITPPGTYDISVTNIDDTTSNKLPFTVTAQ